MYGTSMTQDSVRDTKNYMASSELKKNLGVLYALVSKDFKRKYRRSILGVVWSVLNPLLMMVVMTAVFSYMFKFNIEHFPLYLILGNILFALMSSATTTGMTSIVDSASLIKKIRIEKAVFPIEKVIFSLVNFGFSLIAVFFVMAYLQVFPTWRIVFLPLLLLFVVTFSMGLSLMLSAMGVFFRDVFHLWDVFIVAWTYATPLFYPMDMLAPWMQQVMQFNPMYHYVTYFREIMMWGITPGITENLICLGFALVTFLVGLLVFRKAEKKFILYV